MTRVSSFPPPMFLYSIPLFRVSYVNSFSGMSIPFFRARTSPSSFTLYMRGFRQSEDKRWGCARCPSPGVWCHLGPIDFSSNPSLILGVTADLSLPIAQCDSHRPATALFYLYFDPIFPATNCFVFRVFPPQC